MGVFAHLLERALTGVGERPAALDSASLVIVADRALSVDDVRVLAPRARRVAVVVEALPGNGPGDEEGLPHVEYVLWNSLDRAGFDGSALSVLRRGYDAAWFFRSIDPASGRMLRAMQRCGIGRVVFDDGNRYTVMPIGRAVWHKVRSRLAARWTARGGAANLSPAAINGEIDSFGQALSAVGTAGRADQPGGIDVLHFISSLESGGAERQAALLCREQLRSGMQVRLCTMMPLDGALAHHLPMLAAFAGVAVQAGQIGDRAVIDRVMDELLSRESKRRLMERVPGSIRRQVWNILGDIVLHRPRVVHCWLDEPNVYGGVGAVIAGVERIVLSTRNVNPTNFPTIHQPWMRPWYRFLASQPNVQLVANSASGAADYAKWIGIGQEKFEIIANAIDERDWPIPDDESISRLRGALGVRPGESLVVGVFRLSPEKDPETFVEVIDRLAKRGLAVRGLIVGTGPMQHEVEAALSRRGLTDRVMLAGRRVDVGRYLAAADVVLLTSRHEGTPNCLMEALVLGRPVVATDAGSTGTIVIDGRTGLLAPVGDLPALCEAAARLVADRDLAEGLGRRGRAHVLESFCPGGVVHRMNAIYSGPRGCEIVVERGVQDPAPQRVAGR